MASIWIERALKSEGTLDDNFSVKLCKFYRLNSEKVFSGACDGVSCLSSGTDSLRSALMILGYSDVYHGFVITARQREDCAFWVPLMRRKLHDPTNFQEAINFDSILANCEAVTDEPANAFGEKPMSYYPNPKVILNRRRDVDAWYASMKKTCLEVLSWPMWILSWFDTNICWLWWNFKLVMKDYYRGDFDQYGKQVSEKHYKRLEKRLVDDQRPYLEWSVQDGWEPLCELLGKPVPDVPFPDGNKGGGKFQENMEEAAKDIVMNALRNMGICAALLLSLVIGSIYTSR